MQILQEKICIKNMFLIGAKKEHTVHGQVDLDSVLTLHHHQLPLQETSTWNML